MSTTRLQEMLNRNLNSQAGHHPQQSQAASGAAKRNAEAFASIADRVRQRLAATADRALLDGYYTDPEAKRKVNQAVGALVKDEAANHSRAQQAELTESLLADLFGYGPIQTLVEDASISEIMVNGPDQVWVERGGKLVLTDIRFRDKNDLKRVVERIVQAVGRRIDESNPIADARLPDGSRVNGVLPPVALDGPYLTIRKFGQRPTIEQLVQWDAISSVGVDVLREFVHAAFNTVVSGGTGSGKTTMLNALSSFIPTDNRIVTIEDAAELALQQPHVVRHETRPPNIEGNGEISIRELVKNALRQRPDRIIVGECRGGEALDMLQAMNTGHAGSMTTVHANNPFDAINRLETLVLMAGYDMPSRAIRQQIASAVDIIVQIERLRDGSRKVVSISQVGALGADGNVVVEELLRFRYEGERSEMVEVAGQQYERRYIVGTLVPTGTRLFPHLAESMLAHGVTVPEYLAPVEG